MAYYFDKVANGLQRELGEAPHDINKQLQDTHFEQLYQSPDSKELQKASHLLTSKLEIIGLNFVNLKTYKNKSAKQILDLETQCKNFIKLSFFRKEHEVTERRMREHVESQINYLQEKFTMLGDEVKLIAKTNSEQLSLLKKETLWEIKDCKDLIKTRISEQKVNDLLETLDTRLSKEI